MRHLFAIILAALLAGCASTRHEFAPPSPEWKTAAGQLRYAGPRVTLIGELTVSRGRDGLRMEFGKGAGLSLARVLADATHVRFEGPLVRGTSVHPLGAGKSYSDRVIAAAPARLRGWARAAAATGPVRFTEGGESFTLELPPLR